MPKNPDLVNFTLNLPSKISKSAERIFIKARQKTFGESITADIYDDLVGLLPILGDAVENGPRITDAIGNNDVEAAAIHSADFALTFVPGIGTILNLIIPANTIIKTTEFIECKSSNNSDMDCLFPQDSVERDILDIAI